MSMPDRSEAAAERDATLLRRLCAASQAVFDAYNEWLLEELRDLTVQVEIVESTHEGIIRATAQQDAEWMKDIYHERLRQLRERHRQMMSEMMEFPNSDPFESNPSIEESTYWIEKTARAVLWKRSAVWRLMNPQSPDEAGNPDQEGDEG
jgi:hypothetical protein